MVRHDIIAALKNAVARGATIEEAQNTLINAGYSADDVKESVNYATGNINLKNIISEIRSKSEVAINQNPLAQKQSNQSNQLSQAKASSQISSNKEIVKENPLQKKDINHIQDKEEIKKNEQDLASKNLQNQLAGTNYEKELSKKTKKFPWSIVLLVSLLIFLVGVLVVIILFKENILQFLEKLLG